MTSPQYDEDLFSCFTSFSPAPSLKSKVIELLAHVLEPSTTSEIKETPDGLTPTQICAFSRTPNISAV